MIGNKFCKIQQGEAHPEQDSPASCLAARGCRKAFLQKPAFSGEILYSFKQLVVVIEEETAFRPVFFCIGDELVRHIYQGRTFSFQIRRQQCQKVVSPALSVEQAEALPETPFINGDVGNQMAGRSHSGSGTGCKYEANFLSRHFFPE